MRSRSGFTLIELLIVVTIIWVLAAIAVPNFTCHRREPSNIRSCYATQKTVAGALEMWRLDSGQPAAPFDEAMARRLVNEGYLQSFPADPGFQGDFTLVEVGPIEARRFACLNHGIIAPPEDFGVTARQHLQGLGVTDPSLLSRARNEPIATLPKPSAFRVDRHTWDAFLVGGFVTLGAIVSILAVVWTAGAMHRTIARTGGMWDLRVPTPPAPCTVVTPRRSARRSRPAAPVLEAEAIVFLAEEARCPVCASGYEGRLASAHVCKDCGTLQHLDCFEYTGRCAIFGCDP